MEGPRNNRKLTKGDSDLQVGSGARFAFVVVWTNVLNLHSDFCLNLDDCCFVPKLMKNNFRFIIYTINHFNGVLLCWWYIKQWNLHIRYVQSNFKC